MSTVDERIVEMRFNNKQFEKGIESSVKSLHDLKNGLNLEKSSQSLTNLGRVAGRFSLANISNGVDALTNRFSSLGIVGITAIQNLTNTVLNAGKRFAKALTIDPITTGLQEYETKINAIQTILTNTKSKGTTLDEVNDTLNELNLYADQTIYNFAEMTKNIGTFTAAGVALKPAATAIKGIANLAAGSGSSALQASTAMYQLSQALAAGSVKLQDWNSVVNAGMGGELFQNALKKTAKSMGVVMDTSVPFRESLKDGWITAEVLTKTLADFAADEDLIKAATQVKTFTQLLDTMKESVQSGWAQSWENIIGNKDEAAKLFTGINDAFGAIAGTSANARNELLSFWKANGGREAIIDSLANAFRGLGEIIKPITEAFRDIFPALTGQQLVDFSKKLKSLTDRFKIGEETANNIKRSFRGLFAVIDIGKQLIFALGNGILSLIRYFAPAGDGILSFTGDIGDLLVAINKTLKSSDAFNKIVQKIGKVLSFVANEVKYGVNKIKEAFGSLSGIDTSGIDSFFDKFKERIKPVSTLGNILLKVFGAIGIGVKKIAPIFYKLGDSIADAFKLIRDKIFGGLEDANFNAIFDTLNSGIFVAILFGLKKFIKSLTDITDSAGGFVGQFTDILDGVKGSLQAYQSQLKANILIKIAIAMGILAASLVAISMIDSAKLTTALTAMAVMFGELFGAMALFNKIIAGPGFLSVGKMVIAMLGLSTAVLILSFALTKIAKLDYDGIAKGLLSVAALSATMVGASKLLSSSSGPLIRASVGLILFSTAINILANAVERLGELSTENLIKGLTSVGILLAQLAGFSKLMSGGKSFILTAVALNILGVAMLIFAKAIKDMSGMGWDEIGRGLTVLAGALAIIAGAMYLMPGAILGASALVVVGGALLLIAPMLERFGAMKWDAIGRALTVLAGSLLIIAGAMYLMPGAIPGALALVIVGGALMMLVPTLERLGDMKWDEIGRGLTVLAGSLAIIAGAMYLMVGALPGAAALLVVSGALMILAPALALLGGMSLAEIGKSLLALAGAFTVIGLAALVLTPVIPVIFGLAASILVLGVGLAAIGAGVLAFSAGMTALAVSGAAGAIGLTTIVSAIIGLIPFALKQLAEGIVGMVKTLGDGIPVILEAVTKIIIGILDTIDDLAPRLFKTLDILIVELSKFLIKHVPLLIETGFELLLGLLEGIDKNIYKVIDSAISIILNFIKAIEDRLEDIIQSGVDLVISFIDGVTAGLENNTDRVVESMDKLISTLMTSAGKVLASGATMFVTAGVDLVKGFINGVKSKLGDVKNVAKDLGSTALDSVKGWLGIASPSKKFKEEVGEMIGQGMADGIKASTPVVEGASDEMAQKALDAARAAFENSLDWIEERKYYNQLSLSEELDAWERVQKRYLKGTEERKKADREVYRVKREIDKTNEEYTNKVLDVEKAANEERIRLEQEYYSKTKEINDKLKDDIKSVTDAYTDAVDSRTDSLYRAYGLFDQVETPEEAITGQSLVKNLEDQVKEFDNWQKNITDLAQKGISDGLVKELRDMGPKSNKQIKALNSLSDEELTKYASLWQEKHDSAKTQAILELEDMRIQTESQIDSLQIEAEAKLKEYNRAWAVQMINLKTQTINKVNEIKAEWLAEIGYLRSETEVEFVLMTENVKNTVNNAGWSELGNNIVEGMVYGVKSSARRLAIETAAAAREALNAAKSALGISSPSKEFAKLGEYSGEGFIQGLKSYTANIVKTTKDVGGSTIEGLRNTLANVADMVNSNIDSAPVIRPVLDLTDVKNGTKNLNGLMTATTGISTRNIDVPRVGNNANIEDSVTDNVPTKGTNVQFVQNNYSPKPLSRLEIYRQTRNQISTLKGVVNPV